MPPPSSPAGKEKSTLAPIVVGRAADEVEPAAGESDKIAAALIRLGASIDRARILPIA